MTCHIILALLRLFVSLGAPLFTTIGVFVAAYGTYFVIEWYTPVGGSGFVKSGWVFFRKALKFDIKGIKASVATWAEISKQLGDEDRENTIRGILIIFAGFLLQAFGGFLWFLDVILPQVSFRS